MATADLVLTRTDSSKKHDTISGTLLVRGHFFYTVENRGSPALRTGNYQLKFDYKRTGRPVRCLRPVDCPFTTILIHDAAGDNAANLSGCVGPGLERNAENGGIRRSDEAMKQIMDLLGWYLPQIEPPLDLVTLMVTNNPPGLEGDRDAYWKARKPIVKEKYGIECPAAPTPEVSADPPAPVPVPLIDLQSALNETGEPLPPYAIGTNPF